ncbi:hypothetical protein ACOME3_008086 [Neoechinorhynchus agilis]
MVFSLCGMDSTFDTVVILDAGAQYGKLIDRLVRSLRINTEVLPLDSNTQFDCLHKKFKAVIISGGPSSVNAPSDLLASKIFDQCKIPILGICYGFHLICHARKPGSVRRNDGVREDGQKVIHLLKESRLFVGTPQKQKVLLTHMDYVLEDIEGLETIARSDTCIAAVENDESKVYGVQFHPETGLTEYGKMIFENFLVNIAGCRQTFTMETREEQCMREIREEFAKSNVKAVAVL